MTIPFWLQIVLAIAAACQLTETLRHGSILSPVRAWIESRGAFWSELIGCGFCASHWPPVFTTLLLAGHHWCAASGYVINPFILIIIWFATVRGSNLLNDLTKQWSRTPPRDELNILNLENEDFDDERDNEAEVTAGSETN